MTYQEIANETEGLLTKNTGWIDRYSGYYDDIKANEAYVEVVCKYIDPPYPLKKYLSIGLVKDAKNKVTIDLRVIGHSIAAVIVDLNPELKKQIEDKIKTGLKDKIHSRARVHFKKSGMELVAENSSDKDAFENETKALYADPENNIWEWNSNEVQEFFSFIKKCGFRINSEHTVETLLLDELSKKLSTDKYIKMIQPCTICDQYYQLVTPLKASEAKNDMISYSKDKNGIDRKGGGIDILAHIKRGNLGEICVIELKDKYETNETPAKAIKQAIAYATFIIKLIRCREAQGDSWYEFFEMNKSRLTEKPLKVNAVIAMPYPDENDPGKLGKEDTSFVGETVNVDGDIIELHYIYFKTEALKTAHVEKGITTSLKIPQSE